MNKPILVPRNFKIPAKSWYCRYSFSVILLSVSSVHHALKEMLLSDLPSALDLATDVPEKYLDKCGEYLPESLLAKGYGAKAYGTEGARIWLQKNI